jgi:hypothetical protein
MPARSPIAFSWRCPQTFKTFWLECEKRLSLWVGSSLLWRSVLIQAMGRAGIEAGTIGRRAKGLAVLGIEHTSAADAHHFRDLEADGRTVADDFIQNRQTAEGVATRAANLSGVALHRFLSGVAAGLSTSMATFQNRDHTLPHVDGVADSFDALAERLKALREAHPKPGWTQTLELADRAIEAGQDEEEVVEAALSLCQLPIAKADFDQIVQRAKRGSPAWIMAMLRLNEERADYFGFSDGRDYLTHDHPGVRRAAYGALSADLGFVDGKDADLRALLDQVREAERN